MEGKKGVSVIVCCYNSAARIEPTLLHLQANEAEGVGWEVILVDNASTDNTREVAHAIWSVNPVVSLQIITEDKKGLMNARIRGVKAANFNYFSFIDDDNWVNKDWIRKVYAIFESDESIAACGGSTEAVFEINPPSWFSEFSRSYAVGMQQNETGFVKPEKGFLWGAGLSVRREAWDELFSSGFKSLLHGRSGKALTAGEDSELCLSWHLLGWKLWYDESLKLKHYIPGSRLEPSYLAGLFEGFGKAEVVLSHYRSRQAGYKLSWYRQCLIAVRALLTKGWNRLFAGKSRQFSSYLHWKHQVAYLTELLKSKKKIKFVNDQLDRCFSTNIKKPESAHTLQ